MKDKDTTTYDDIIRLAEEIEKYAPRKYNDLTAFKPMHFAGMPVYEAKDQVYPKLQLTEAFADKWLTDEAKDRINAKLVDLLGVRVVKVIPDGMIYIAGDYIIAKPEGLSRLLSTSV